MDRSRWQSLILIAGVALLLAAVVHIYRVRTAMAPTNLKGHIAIEGGPTANPTPP